jgi:hypothetical protein
MVNYMKHPQSVTTITHSAVAYTPEVTKFDVHRLENGFDSATICIADTKSLNYGTRAAVGDAITLDVKDYTDAVPTRIFSGIIRACLPSIDANEGQFLVLKCDGSGYGFAECLVGSEFGLDSRNPTYDTIGEIVGAGDAGVGILHAWVNHYLGDTGAASNYVYTSDLEAMTGDIKYICFPYKPANRCIDDLCDLVTAIRQGAAYHPDHIGPHWIIDTDNMLRMKLVNGTQAGWTKYYGDSAANATLVQGTDFLAVEFQDLDPEANCVLFYGDWRRPSNGDSWTEGTSASLWGHTVADIEVINDPLSIVGDDCIRIESPTGANGYAWIPIGKAAGWDLTSIGTEQNIPTLNWYAMVNDNTFGLGMVVMWDVGVKYFDYDFTSAFTANNTWYHFSLPIGTYYNYKEEKKAPQWTAHGGVTWDSINALQFYFGGSVGKYLYIDGLHMGGASVCRVAKNSTSITAKKLRTRIIVDNVGKDDSLLDTDDSGLMAQMAYSELLRLQSQPKVGTLITPMIRDLLCGQWLRINALTKADGTFAVNDKDMRITELHQIADCKQGYVTSIQVTDDLTNTHARKRYDDINKVQGAFRPEWQDRQAASLKASGIDINVVKLEKDYP